MNQSANRPTIQAYNSIQNSSQIGLSYAIYAVSLLAEGGEWFSVSLRCSGLRRSASLGLPMISSLLHATGDPTSDDLSPGLSDAAWMAAAALAAAAGSGRFIM